MSASIRRRAAGLAAAAVSVVGFAVAAQPADAATASAPAIVPRPVSLITGHGTFRITPRTHIVASPAARAVARQLARDLRPATGYPLAIRTGAPRAGDIRLVLRNVPWLSGARAREGYRLVVTHHHVTIAARTPHGLFNGVQTIRQLLPGRVASAHRQAGPWTMPVVSVTDYPRYSYRGYMIDIARHYRTPHDVKRLIDIASTYKMNVLHLHLSDDQGFRVVINGFPRLTSIGAQGSVGTQGRTMDPGGFWTQAEYRSVVAYAAARFMTVVPEVDSPSHNNAIEMSEYGDTANPHLNGHPQDISCGYKTPPVWNYSMDVGYSGMCPNSTNTWAIYRAIIHQLTAMSPGPYYHLGGDEAHPFTTQQYADFVNHETKIVQHYGKIPMGWADGYATTAGSNPPAGSIAESWLPGATDGAAAVKKGMKVVMAPADHAYVDQTFPNDSSGLGLDWACSKCDLDKAYNWEPGAFPGVPNSSVIGVEAAQWSETTRTLGDVEYLMLPRLLAIAEVGWSPKADRSGPDSAAYRNFVRRVAAQQSRFDAQGLRYYHSAQVPWSH